VAQRPAQTRVGVYLRLGPRVHASRLSLDADGPVVAVVGGGGLARVPRDASSDDVGGAVAAEADIAERCRESGAAGRADVEGRHVARPGTCRVVAGDGCDLGEGRVSTALPARYLDYGEAGLADSGGEVMQIHERTSFVGGRARARGDM